MITLRERAKGIYLSVKFGEPMPLWAVREYIAQAFLWSREDVEAMTFDELAQTLAAWYAQARLMAEEDGETDTVEIDLIRACYAAIERISQRAEA